jgi:ABC-type uncharacterized transport system permease subunit
MNVEPWTKLRPDGSFSSTEKYVVRYRDGSHDTFRVTFAGQFVAGGAAGTLTARVQSTDKHHRLYAPCLTGTQTWSAVT